MSKKITDLTLKSIAAAADILLINDVSTGSDKRTTVAGIVAALMSNLGTAFSDLVQSFSNTGTAGGSGYYVNLGGIKLLWFISANQSSGAAGTTYTVTLPTSFFSSVTMAQATSINQTAVAEQYANVASVSSSSVSVRITSPNGSATSGVSLFLIGT